MSELELGNMFELNKSIRRKSAVMEEEKINLTIGNVAAWCSSHPHTKHFMLLCKERSDYTVFRLNSFNYNQLGQELREVLESRGEILGIDYMHGYDSYECWVRDENQEPFMFMFFDCEGFVVEVN